MKDKRTIFLAVILLVLVGVFVWHSQRISKSSLPKGAASEISLDPKRNLMRNVAKAVNAYKTNNKNVPKNLDELKGEYLDEETLREAKAKNLEYVYVNPQAYRIRFPTAKPPVALAQKAPLAKKKEEPQSAFSEAGSVVDSSDVVTTKTGWEYDPRGKPDPFKPFIIARRAPAETGVPKVTRQLTPLQKMPLSEIQSGLKAIIWGELGSKALVEDAAGKGYVLQEGTYVGQNDGIVKKILQDRIVIEEYRRDPVHESLVTNEVVLKLKKGEEGED